MRCPICKTHAITGEEYDGDLHKELPTTSPYGYPNPKRPEWLSYRCNKCKAEFKKMSGLVHHVDKFGHDARSKFACRTCHAVYTSFTGLYNHLRQNKHFSNEIRPRQRAE
jgi:hypothetical protein